ncbi:PREDICTED: putative uncharacterized protein FLJ37770 [Vollenhovia emeryi]|uniref:putative uncharacterized protein FLJ37770 n=1 Tax=Vollenhovia emeryi TaxID=411798 RepID=UPI0005F472B6|nr:PREDICTED: putative uncharacterized protein FLJ37770 [Vollenhovia emeryi]
MQRTLEQRYAVKFCVGLGKSGTETLAMIRQVFGSDSLSQTAVFKWHKLFKDGRESVEDKPRAGRPSTSRTDDNVQRVRDVLNSNRRLSVRMIADQIGIDKMIVHTIITEDLAIRKICAKFVPKVLTDDQKQRRVSACEDLLQRVEEDLDFLDNVITGDESWIFEYDPETKRQSAEWHTAASPRPKKARMSKSRVKALLIVFFDVKGVVYQEFVPPGQTVNGAFYLEVLKRLTRRVNRVRPAIAANWKLHHDNAPRHSCFLVTDYLIKIGITTVSQPPYSPDVAPADFFLFPKVKTTFKGRYHGTLHTVKQACTRALKDIAESDYQGAFEAWKSRWQKCVDAQGSYFEEF